jgi:hypothetical protein
MPPSSSSEAVMGDVCRISEDSSISNTSSSCTTETTIPPVIKEYSSTRSSADGSRTMERSVSFNAVVQVMEVLNKDQYYKSENIRTWYSGQELLRIQREGLNTCKRLQQNCLHPGDCTRGLESHSKAGFTKVRKNRLLSKFAVLEEQKKLRAKSSRSTPVLIGGNCTGRSHQFV